MRDRFTGMLMTLLLLDGCSVANGSSQPGQLKVGASSAYFGVGDSCHVISGYCLRGPGVGFDIAVSQSGNAANFRASSSDPSIASGSLVMLGPGGRGGPVAIRLAPHKAGVATLTISGDGGITADLPVTVTTVSTMTITLNGLPTAADLSISVASPQSPQCPPFVGGYQFDASPPTLPSTSITFVNFPAMGNGPSSLCVFSTVSVAVKDNANITIAQKTIHPTINLGRDNPQVMTIP